MARYSNVKRVNGHLQVMGKTTKSMVDKTKSQRASKDVSNMKTNAEYKLAKAKDEDEAKRKKAAMAVKSMRSKQWNPRRSIQNMSPAKRRYTKKG